MEPLAAKIRPNTLSEFIGQEHLVGPGQPLRIAIEKKHLFSFILWGPPGVGKTTLARLYAQAISAEYHELLAVSAGKEDIKAILHRDGGLFGPKLLFLDEIHRFNKAQQDFLLPYVEAGQLILVGATTENPSFEVIPALLSRCRVFVLQSLTDDELRKIIDRSGIVTDAVASDWLIAVADGDARQLLAMMDTTRKLYGEITLTSLQNTLQSKFLRYDKKGEEHYTTISAFIKSMRARQPDAALYYLARMIEAGEEAKFIARRMVIFASEDIGIADSQALTVANAVFRAVETVGYPEAGINLAHGVVYLARAPKSRVAYDAYQAARQDVQTHGALPVPLLLRNAPTKLMKDLGYHEGYELYTKEDLFPKKLHGTRYLDIADE